jgi:quercetin dioxygenase-like cupin family protein
VHISDQQKAKEKNMTNDQNTSKGVAIDMNASIAYADGSVVSKTLLDKKAGTLTLFSFDAGQGLSEHTAAYDATVQVIDGEADITIDGETQTVQAGELIIMPANIPHALRATKKFKMLLIMIREQDNK